jgi:iron complex transport system ATP-binding protein
MEPALRVRDLNFGYSSQEIFERMSFTIEPGAMVALLGANGVGKTTLLNLLSGLLRPRRGEVIVNGQDVTAWRRRDLARFVSLVPQLLETPFLFRVEEIVSQGRVPYLGRFGGLSEQDHAVVSRAMEQVDVTGLRDRIFTELSGGEQQRVKIAIALAQEPKIMLLDEPTQHLDIGRQIELLRVLRQLNEGGITIIAAVHDLSLVSAHFSEAILLMNRSCISGEVEDVMRAELLAEAFQVDLASVQPFCVAVLSEPDAERGCRKLLTRRRSILPNLQ